MNLFGNVEAAPTPEPETEEIQYKHKKSVSKREEDLSGLPVERIYYELSESERGCPECGETMRDIGVEVRRELKLIPAKVAVLEKQLTPMLAGIAIKLTYPFLSPRRRFPRRCFAGRRNLRRLWHT